MPKSASTKLRLISESAARGLRGNARAQRGVKHSRWRNHREIVKRAPQGAEILSAMAAAGADGEMLLDGAPLGRLGAAVQVLD
jgi:hypothetical protein